MTTTTEESIAQKARGIEAQKHRSLTSLRPSSMPKLAVCSKYTNSPFEAGPAAMRGTLADEAYRHYFTGERIFCPDCGGYATDDDEFCSVCFDAETDSHGTVSALEILDNRIANLGEENGMDLLPAADGVKWAIAYTQVLAGDDEIVTDEKRLQVTVKEMDSKGGTMDGDIPSKSIGIDLKTGHIRNYKEQFATYALGRMRADFLDEYTFFGLFSDRKEAVKMTFTYDEAEMIVQTIRRDALDPSVKAVPCDYCSWCGSAQECPERLQLATKVFSYQNLQERWKSIQDDPEELTQFIASASELDDFIKEGKRSLLSFIEDGVEVKGFHKVKGRTGSQFIKPDNLLGFAKQHGISQADIIRSMGNLSKKKFTELCAKHGDEGAVEASVAAPYATGATGSPYLAKSKTKKKVSEKA